MLPDFRPLFDDTEHWSAFEQISTVLKPGGRALISSFLKGTLLAWRELWGGRNDQGFLSLSEIKSFKIHNVTPEFVKSFKDVGFPNITADQAKSLKIHNVTPEFVKALKEDDPNVSLDQAIRIKIQF